MHSPLIEMNVAC